jgi:hypothetical protein
MSSAVEVKVVFSEGGETRVLRGTLTGQDSDFVFIQRRDGLFRIAKHSIVLIETPAFGEGDG